MEEPPAGTTCAYTGGPYAWGVANIEAAATEGISAQG